MIPAGTMLTRDHVKVVQWPASSRLDGSLSDPRTVVDRGAIITIARTRMPKVVAEPVA